MQNNLFSFWGSFKDYITEKKFLAFLHSEIQTRNRIAMFVGGIAILLVGISDFFRIPIGIDLFISIGIRIALFMFTLILFLQWKVKKHINFIYTYSFIFTLLVGNSIIAIIYFLNKDLIIDIIDLLTVPLTYILVYVFIIIPVQFLVLSGIITSVLYIGMLTHFNNIDTTTIFILSIILITVNIMGVYINRFLSIVRRNEFLRIQEIKKLNKGLHEEIEERKTIQEKLQTAYNEITESMQYANHLQVSLLPDLTVLKQHISDYFIYYKPCDIVCGDFYWLTTQNNKIIITVADCTGHGIRAGFMSFMAFTLLEDIVQVKGITKAGEILDNLREHIIKNLRQTEVNSKMQDGLDMTLCVIDTNTMTLEFAGAFNPLLVISNHQMTEYKADRMPVSHYIAAKPNFTTQTIPIAKGDKLYLFTDGYPDQFGGVNNKKYTYKRFKRDLIINSKLSMEEQKEMFAYIHTNWQGNESQTDDIIVLGLQI